MRDIVITAVAGFLILMIFKHPAFGAYTWAWLSLMSPHRMTYGFAGGLPFAMVTALITILVFATTRQRRSLPNTAPIWVLLALIFWMTVTSFFALAPQALVWDRWIFVIKIQIMTLITMMLIVEPKQLRTLIWVVTLSVCFYGIKGGIYTISTGGSGRVWGPGGTMLEGNNELAVGLVILFPMLYFLWQTESRIWVRRAMAFSSVSVLLSILGSQSRGALLALLSMGLLLGLKGKYPVRTSIGLMILMVVAIAFMPDSWTARMDTMRDHTADQSAMSRIWTWTTLWNVGVDRPLVGAGFRADTGAIFQRYAPTDEKYAIFIGQVFVAHSIYLQMLGEHGFVGLGLFLALGVATWRTASVLAKRTTGDAEFGSWMPLLMRMIQVSLVGYAVGGAFLSLAYHDLPYYLVGFVAISYALVGERDKRARVATGSAASLPVVRRRAPAKAVSR
jgi:probable O-glycosylation ligase (exosortase A-associated)